MKYKEDEAHELYQSSGEEFLTTLGLGDQEAAVAESNE